MANKKTDSTQRDAAAVTPSARAQPARPSEKPALSGKPVGLSFDALLGHVSGAEERQAQSLIQDQSNPATESGPSGDGADPDPSATVSGRPTVKERPRDKVYAGAVASLSRRQPTRHARRESTGAVRQKVMMGLIPVLALALVFIVKNPLKVSAVPPAPQGSSAIAASAAETDPAIDWKIPPLYQPGDRDPMQLPAAPTTPQVEDGNEPIAPAQTRIALTVSGILFSQDRPAAIVDTHLVHEGEQVAGATVKKIEMDAVVFELNGQTWKQAVDKH